MAIQQLQQQNIAAASGFVEVSLALLGRINELTLQLRLNDTLYWYTAPSANAPANNGNIANLPAVYGTIAPGASRTIRGLLGAQKIYFQLATSQSGQVIEVDYYADT